MIPWGSNVSRREIDLCKTNEKEDGWVSIRYSRHRQSEGNMYIRWIQAIVEANTNGMSTYCIRLSMEIMYCISMRKERDARRVRPTTWCVLSKEDLHVRINRHERLVCVERCPVTWNWQMEACRLFSLRKSELFSVRVRLETDIRVRRGHVLSFTRYRTWRGWDYIQCDPLGDIFVLFVQMRETSEGGNESCEFLSLSSFVIHQ